jgi:hypothetical protein
VDKAGSTKIHDIRELVRVANARKETLVVNMDRGDQKAVVVVATGKRATLLRRLAEEFSEV